MGGGGSKPKTPADIDQSLAPFPPNMGPVEDSVIKTKNENGLHVFTINLDANQDGHGVSPWSIVAIVMATLIALIIIKKLWQCCLKHRPWAYAKHVHHLPQQHPVVHTVGLNHVQDVKAPRVAEDLRPGLP